MRIIIRGICSVTAAYLIVACGSGTEISVPTQCSVDLAFSGVEEGEVSDVVKFEAFTTNECLVMTGQRKGGLIWSVEMIDENALGRIKEISMGVGRNVELSDSTADGDIADGAALVKRSYMVEGLTNASDKNWLLPWGNQPATFKVSVSVDSGTKPESYPKQIKVTLESLEKSDVKVGKKSMIK